MIITERGAIRGRGRVSVDESTTRVRQTTSIFTVVQDGGQGRLTVAAEVPHQLIAFLYDYATARGYLAAGIQFRRVGTSLVVRPTVLPDGSIRVRLAPHIAYVTPAGGGELEFAEAATELIVPNGAPVSLGGASGQLHALTRHILGHRASQTAREVSMELTATAQ